MIFNVNVIYSDLFKFDLFEFKKLYKAIMKFFKLFI
jgi:hypothetical protein